MALKLFKDKITPSIGDLVRPRMISDMAGDVASEFYKDAPRKIFVIQWMHGAAWAKQSIRTEYQAHQLEIISKAKK